MSKCYMLYLIAVAALVVGACAQEPQVPSTPAAVIRKESRLVLVDAVVTDKKGSYIRDLTANDFRVLEDDKEQTIRSFSVESSAVSVEHKRYLILFFDLASMSGEGRHLAQDAALKFIDGDGARDRSIAVVEYAGSLKVKQNFTENAERLKAAIGELNTRTAPAVDSVSSAASLASAERDIDARSTLLAIRSLARNVAAVPGRKSVVLFTSGFPVAPELLSEITAAIDACNKANVAIYPIDVRGLIASNAQPDPSVVAKLSPDPSWSLRRAALSGQPRLMFASYLFSADPQRSGGSRGGGSGSGSRTGSSSRSTRVSGPSLATPLTSQPSIIRQLPPGPMDNQAIMHMLAEGTGGFVILNVNTLLPGLEKIAREQREYYLLGYVPAVAADGSCHELKVKVNRGGTIVRSRSGYCNVKSKDMLAGTETETQLQAQLSSNDRGLSAAMSVPFFYTEPNTARINLVMDIPASAMTIEKEKDRHVVSVNVLGIAYRPDGSIGGRFSDTAKTSFESKHDAEEFRKQPYHYEKQFELASGSYELKVVFSSKGQAFGKLSAPLAIDEYDGKQVGISGIALVSNPRPATEGLAPDAAITEDRSPLVYRGLLMQPSATNRFNRKSDKPVLYAELYDEQLAKTEKPVVKVRYRIVDAANQQLKSDTGSFEYPTDGVRAGTVALLCLRLPLENLPSGKYMLQLLTSSNGKDSKMRSVNFEVE